jgi:hypothetical protein
MLIESITFADLTMLLTEVAGQPQVIVRIRQTVTNGTPKWSKENCIHALSTCSLAMAPPEESQGCAILHFAPTHLNYD